MNYKSPKLCKINVLGMHENSRSINVRNVYVVISVHWGLIGNIMVPKIKFFMITSCSVNDVNVFKIHVMIVLVYVLRNLQIKPAAHKPIIFLSAGEKSSFVG